jgi:hypothetical protein
VRTALCLSGQLRCFKQTYQSIKEHLIDPLGADVYVSVWDYQLPDERNRIDGDVAECRSLYRAVCADVEAFGPAEQEHYANHPACQHRFDEVHVDRVLAMWRRIKRAFLLAKEGRYDLYIRCRFDLKFLTGIPTHEMFVMRENELVGIPHSRDYESVRNDQFAFGSCAAMQQYVAVLDSVQPLIDQGFKIHPERLLFEHLKRVGLATLPSSIQYRVLRSHGEENPCL